MNCLLYADGVFFDKVNYVGHLSTFEVLEESYDAVRQWADLRDLHLGSSGIYFGKGTIKNAFWRTMTGDVVVSKHGIHTFGMTERQKSTSMILIHGGSM